MDNLEEYIKKHREEMDKYRPSSAIWKRIRRELYSGKHFGWMSAAALIAVIIGTALVLVRPGFNVFQKPDGSAGKNETTLINLQLKEAEIYYNNLANTLFREATPLLARNPEIEKELFTDISQLDSICREIKKDLKDNVANQDVIEALIQNYRIKIRLLEDMLTILKENEDNKEKNRGDEL